MRVLSNNEFRTIEQLVSLNQKELHGAMVSFLTKKYDNVIVNDKYICAEGDIPIALVAHMDTVFKVPAYEVFYDPRQNVLWSPQGLGADDRAGVFAIIQIIRTGLRPHIIFTTDEEMGCLGADALAKNPCPFKELKYIIQLDRQGAIDCVFYDCYDPNFIDYIESFGFAEAWGTFSDISVLCPAWHICGANLSIGYYNEHSVIETLYVGQMYETINKVISMLREENIPTFTYRRANRAHYSYWMQDKYNNVDITVYCEHCGKSFSEYDTFPVKSKDYHTVYYCVDCIADNVEWCTNCDEPFEITHQDQKLCNDCAEAFNYGTD